MKIMVTGGAGFIGSHVVDKLVEEGHEVVVLDDLSNGKKENVNEKARFIKASIASKELHEIMQKEKPEVIYHIAAHINVRYSVKNPLHDASINVLGTINLLEAARFSGVKKIIYSSTGGAIYGDTRRYPTMETEDPDAICHYGVSKYCAERYLFLYKHLYGIDYKILRYSNVYGPRQDPLGEAGVVAIFITNILKRDKCRINGDGSQTRDYVYVKDVVRANFLALTNDSQEQVFNIATGKETDVNEIFNLIAAELPNQDAKSFNADAIPGEVMRSCLDSSKARILLQWQPQTNIKQGIKETVEYFIRAASASEKAS